MVSSSTFFWALVQLSVVQASISLGLGAADPCVAIAGKKWVAPSDVRACYSSFGVDPVIKTNVSYLRCFCHPAINVVPQILDVANKTLAFHTSVNYQIQAPPPFNNDVKEDLLADIARIREQSYHSDYDLHIDLSRSFKRLNDGHCVWVNLCYVGHVYSFVDMS